MVRCSMRAPKKWAEVAGAVSFTSVLHSQCVLELVLKKGPLVLPFVYPPGIINFAYGPMNLFYIDQKVYRNANNAP